MPTPAPGQTGVYSLSPGFIKVDSEDFTLRPGEGVEMKYHLRWKADGKLSYEFHGEPDQKPNKDYFESDHLDDKIVKESSYGSFTAPTTGFFDSAKMFAGGSTGDIPVEDVTFSTRRTAEYTMDGAMLRTSCAILALAFAATASAAATCESLSSLALKDTTITTAQSVAAGAFAPAEGGGGRGGKGKQGPSYSDLAAFCRVAFTLKPSSDSDIKVELWMPAIGWNNKYEADGNGGWTGSITPNTLAAALRRGYAVSMTDTGHEGGSASFALGHPEKIIDFGYRAVHEMAVKSKSIIAAFYGDGPRYSYWNGCSAGGKQGLKEAQMFPGDFDGIVAGTPVNDWVGRAVGAVWIAQAMHNDEASYIPPAKYPAIHKAALDACDALDGVKDGVIDEPQKCKFDPKVMECKGADAPDCLTPPQVEGARKIYSGVINPRTKEVIFPGLLPGSEMGWGTQAGAQPFGPGADLFKYVVFNDEKWDYKMLNFDTGVAQAVKADNNIMNAIDPNLKPYFDRGGKVLQYQGWADQQMTGGNSPKYYQSVLEKLGGLSKVRDNYRLFMVPGMGHCGGGDGTETFDKLEVLEQWVEAKKAPDQIIASHVVNGTAVRTRPLCPYPQVAVYKGSGSTDEAANFSCKAK